MPDIPVNHETSNIISSLIAQWPRADSTRYSKGKGRTPSSTGDGSRVPLFFLFLFIASGVSAAWAGELPVTSTAPPLHEVVPPEPFVGSASFMFDNDFMTGNDNKYTGGLGVVWTSAATETYGQRNLHRKIANAFSFLPAVGGERNNTYVQFRLGMEMYTPTDIKSPEPPPGDHPYAGVIYLDSSLLSKNPAASHQFTLRLGLVGPATGAEDVQRWIHEIIDSPIPRGWDTQLENEPIVNVFYQYNRRLVRRAPRDRFGMDISANGGAGFGNYYIGANLGMMGRIGYRLPDNYGVTPLLGGAESLVGVNPARKRFQAYFYLSAQSFGVFRWLPTDGNTFQDSRSGDRDDWFLSLSTGLCLGYGRVLLSYRYHGLAGLEDPENFKTENRNDFGTMMLTVFLG
jgi:hypothetical protein